MIGGAWDKTIDFQCINLNALAYATGGIFVVQDLAILILPIPQCLKLQMGRRQKANVLFMFGIGVMYVSYVLSPSLFLFSISKSYIYRRSSACIVSIIRLKYLATFANSENLTCKFLPNEPFPPFSLSQ
jgi:hypothetical protein